MYVVPMGDFVNDLRIKLDVDRKIYNIIFGGNQVMKRLNSNVTNSKDDKSQFSKKTKSVKFSENNTATVKRMESMRTILSKGKNMKQSSLDANTRDLTYYNTLKTVIDNCSFDVEMGDDGLVRDKSVHLNKLFGIVNDAKQQMKVNLILSEEMLHQKHVSIEEFADALKHLEMEDNLF